MKACLNCIRFLLVIAVIYPAVSMTGCSDCVTEPSNQVYTDNASFDERTCDFDIFPGTLIPVAPGSACGPYWDVVKDSQNDIIRVTYGWHGHHPEYACLHMDSGFLRMNYGPQSSWGASIIVPPCFWAGDPGDLYQGELNDLLTYDWHTEQRDLVLEIQGSIYTLNFIGRIRFFPPTGDSLSAEIDMYVSGDADLSYRPGETYKPVMISTMHISDEEWDVQLAYVSDQTFEIPDEGWIVHPPALDSFFGVMGGTSEWQANTPTVEITMDDTRQITGWVDPDTNPNNENVGFWAATDYIVRSYSYAVVARAAD